MAFSHYTQFVLTLLTSCAVRSITADPSVTWTFPSNGKVETYNRTDILVASWITNLDHMPLLTTLCQETTSRDISNISSHWVSSSGSRMISLDLFAGINYPYICKLDFVDGANGKRLDQPSNAFYIANVASTPPKVWSENKLSLVLPSNSTNQSTLECPTNTSAGASVPQGSISVTSQPSSGLSTGGIVGVAIAALTGGALMAAAATFFWLRRRQSRQVPTMTWKDQESPPSTWLNVVKDGHAEVQEKDAGGVAQRAEIGNTAWTPELGTGARESLVRSP
ncbi:MAG: hypothetical protein Q9182_005553 [Xanthomendoza sp. 2 TL-2023]